MVFPYTLHALVKERWLVWLCCPSGLRTRTTGLIFNFKFVFWWHDAHWLWLHLYTRRPTLRPRFSQALLPRLLINRFIWFPPGQPNRSWPWALRLAVRGFSSIEAVELGFVWVWYLPPLRIVRFPAPITKFIDAYPWLRQSDGLAPYAWAVSSQARTQVHYMHGFEPCQRVPSAYNEVSRSQI